MKIDDKTSHKSPSIRFPEFTGEWEESTIGKEFDLYSGNTPSRLNKEHFKGKVNWISSGELKNHYIYSSKEQISEDAAKNLKLLPKGTFVIAIYGLEAEGVRGTGSITQEPSTISQACMAFIPQGDIENEFLYSWYKKHGEVIGVRYAQGTKQQNLSYDILEKFKIAYPSIKEQKKLNKFIALLDERIAVQNRLIDRLQSLIKGIMVKLQQQGLSKGTWKRVPLSSILKERTELNEGLLPVYSVSVSQGVVNQMEYLGRSFAAKDTSKYHVAHFGDLIYTKSPTGSFPYGIVKQNSNRYKVAVSPLYGVYTPANYFTGVFLQEYFKSEVNTFNYLHSLIQKGAKNTINITNQRFLDNYILIPTDSNDLQQISNLLLRLNAKKDLMQNMLQQYQEQKQYLLRQMFI